MARFYIYFPIPWFWSGGTFQILRWQWLAKLVAMCKWELTLTVLEAVGRPQVPIPFVSTVWPPVRLQYVVALRPQQIFYVTLQLQEKKNPF